MTTPETQAIAGVNEPAYEPTYYESHKSRILFHFLTFSPVNRI